MTFNAPHIDEPHWRQLPQEDIATVAAEAYEVVEELVWQVLRAQHPATP